MRVEAGRKVYLLQPIMSAWAGNGINKFISFYYKIIAENNTFSFSKVLTLDFLSFPTVRKYKVLYSLLYSLFIYIISLQFCKGLYTKWKQYLTP